MQTSFQELAHRASDSNSDLAELLRNLYLIGRTSGREDIASWAKNEMDGYADRKKLPSYRMLKGVVKAHSPIGGWKEIACDEESAVMQYASITLYVHSVDDIQENIGKAKGIMAAFSVDEDIANLLRTAIGRQFPVANHVPISSLRTLLSCVRTQALDWIIDLNSSGNLSTNPTLRAMAQGSEAGTVNNFHFHQNVSGSMIQGSAASSPQIMMQPGGLEPVLNQILAEIRRSGADDEQLERAELQADLLQSQAQLPIGRRSKEKIDKAFKGLSNISTVLSVTKNVHDLLEAVHRHFP